MVRSSNTMIRAAKMFAQNLAAVLKGVATFVAMLVFFMGVAMLPLWIGFGFVYYRTGWLIFTSKNEPDLALVYTMMLLVGALGWWVVLWAGITTYEDMAEDLAT